MTGWQAVRAQVLERVRAGNWGPGALLPPEAELAEAFGTSRATVNRALQDLAATGLLTRKRRAGTRVADTPARRVTLEIPVIRQEVERAGKRYGYTVVAQTFGEAPLGVYSAMKLRGMPPLRHILAMHFADSAVWAYEDRWLNPEAVPGLATTQFFTVSANEWLVRNVPFSTGRMQMSAQAASAEEASALGCARGASVFVLERETWLGEVAITRVRLTYAPGYRVTLGF